MKIDFSYEEDRFQITAGDWSKPFRGIRHKDVRVLVRAYKATKHLKNRKERWFVKPWVKAAEIAVGLDDERSSLNLKYLVTIRPSPHLYTLPMIRVSLYKAGILTYGEFSHNSMYNPSKEINDWIMAISPEGW